jgi:hypothetical protein
MTTMQRLTYVLVGAIVAGLVLAGGTAVAKKRGGGGCEAGPGIVQPWVKVIDANGHVFVTTAQDAYLRNHDEDETNDVDALAFCGYYPDSVGPRD